MKPFNLEKALAGELCVTRDGRKAVVIGSMGERKDLDFDIDTPLVGYVYGSMYVVYWTETGRLSPASEAPRDIVGMWEEPRPTVTLTLPCPLKHINPGDTVWVINSSFVVVKWLVNPSCITTETQRCLDLGLAFATEQDAMVWVSALRNNRK